MWLAPPSPKIWKPFRDSESVELVLVCAKFVELVLQPDASTNSPKLKNWKKWKICMAAPSQAMNLDVLRPVLDSWRLVLAACKFPELVLSRCPSTNSSKIDFCQICKFCMAAPWQDTNLDVLRLVLENLELVLAKCTFFRVCAATGREH